LQFPNQFLNSAYLSQNGEPAWPMDNAIKVIDWATKSDIAVFSVEIWLPTDPGPTIPAPIIYAFDLEQEPNEMWQPFVRRANTAAREYIRTFEWDNSDETHKNQTPYFNLTLGTN